MSEGELKKRLLPYFLKLEGEFGAGESGEGFTEELNTILDEIRREFPIKGYSMELEETELYTLTDHLEFDIPTQQDLINLIRWFMRWFGKIVPQK